MYTVGIVKLLTGSVALMFGLLALFNIMSESSVHIGAAAVYLIVPGFILVTVIDIASGIYILRNNSINLLIFIFNIVYGLLSFIVLVGAGLGGGEDLGFVLFCFGMFVYPYLFCVNAKIKYLRKEAAITEAS